MFLLSRAFVFFTFAVTLLSTALALPLGNHCLVARDGVELNKCGNCPILVSSQQIRCSCGAPADPNDKAAVSEFCASKAMAKADSAHAKVYMEGIQKAMEDANSAHAWVYKETKKAMEKADSAHTRVDAKETKKAMKKANEAHAWVNAKETEEATVKANEARKKVYAQEFKKGMKGFGYTATTIKKADGSKERVFVRPPNPFYYWDGDVRKPSLDVSKYPLFPPKKHVLFNTS